MLTIFAIKDAKQAAKYYEDDNYYHRGSIEAIAATHWFGKGAEILGLSDYVDPARFAELLEGQIDKNTQLSRVRHDEGVAHKPGYDLTFSAPKSVSILAEIGQDYRIHEAHDRAVNTALKYLESRGSRYRQTIDSLTETYKSDNLTIAKFRHDTSRSVEGEVDCQLHTHCVVLNATFCEDGKWRSLSEKPLFDFKMTGGMIYRAELAKELKALGYKIEKTREDGLFEIAGFTREQIEEFSQRRVKILEVMKEFGLFGPEAAQAMALMGREGKQPIDRDKLHGVWAERAREAGINLDGLIQESLRLEKRIKQGSYQSKNLDTKVLSDRSLGYAIQHLGERESVFKEQDVIKTALQYSLGDVGIEDIHQAIERSKEAKHLVHLGQHKDLDIYTSSQVLEKERRIVEIMRNGLNEVDAIVSKEAMALYLEDVIRRAPEGGKPTNCQLKAIDFVGTSTNRIIGVQGYAGTGKTTMLNAICRLAEASDYQIRGASPGASAADVLRGETGIKTETLSSLLLELEKEKHRKDFDLLLDHERPQKPEIIILDEASMASTHQMLALLEHVESLNKILFLVGDRYQLPSVEAGSPYGLMQDADMPFVTMEQVVRQEALDLKAAVNETIAGNVGYAFEAISSEEFIQRNSDGEALWSPESRIHEISNKDDRLKAISEDYLNLEAKGRDETIVLLGSNEDRQTVNSAIREGLKFQGVISGIEAECLILKPKDMTAIERTHIFNYEVGDIVRFNKAYRSLGIERFDYLTVIGRDAEKEELIFQGSGRNKSDQEIRWKPEGSSISKGGAVSVFQQEVRALAAGDFIRWTQNRKAERIFNTETAQVLSIIEKANGKKVAKVKLNRGDEIELDLTNSVHSHWDYAWSSTIYAAQGKKARNVIAQLEGANPNLTNYRSFYVALSRAVNNIQLYVDDLDKAIKTIEKQTGEKSNATEFLKAHQEKQQYEQHIQTAYLKLEGNLHQKPNEIARLIGLARQYANLEDRSRAHLIATDFKDRLRLTGLIRDCLKEQGQLGKIDFSREALRTKRVRTDDAKMNLKTGMQVSFDRAYRNRGIEKGDYFAVTEICEITKTATLRNLEGRSINLDIEFLVKRQDADVGIYQAEIKELSVKEEILWTKTHKDLGLVKNEGAKVLEITEEGFVFELKDRTQLTIDRSHPAIKHWRHAYVKNLDDALPKNYELGLAHLDEKIQSPTRIAAILGAMGQAKKASHVYTHSKDYVIQKIKEITKEEREIQTFEWGTRRKEVHEALDQFAQSKKTISKAWVTYFEAKKNGTLGPQVEESLKNTLILERAQAELASQIIASPDFNPKEAKAFGLDPEKIQSYSDRHELVQIVNRYEQSQGILRGHYACQIRESFGSFSQELEARNLDKKKLLEESWVHQKRLDRVRLNPEERRDSKILETYFEYAGEARSLWARITRTKESERGTPKPDRSQFTFANHVSSLRNKLAQEISSNPERFDPLMINLKEKTKGLIQAHAFKFQQDLEREIKRTASLMTRDWRMVVAQEQADNNQASQVKKIRPENTRVYWDREQVLREVMVKAEALISGLLSEDINNKRSTPSKTVWGKKHGSVTLHLSGSKEGLVNDYERGIHGDVITYYAKYRGIDWYDAISELASMVGLDPERGSIKRVVSPAEEKLKAELAIKKEQALLEEEKRRIRLQQVAQKIWKESQPIKGTLAERYLKEHRGMDFDLSKLEMRYHSAAPDFTGSRSTKPAMVVGFFNAQKELTSVQCTYLDPKTANKDKNLEVVKRTIGQLRGSAGLIYQGGDERVVVAEGAETAASLIPAVKDGSIYISGGNMQNVGHLSFLADQHETKEIHIAADNDLSFEVPSWKATEAGARKLESEGVRPLIALPKVVNGTKTDFNDVLKKFGSEEVIRQFQPKFEMARDQFSIGGPRLTEIQEKEKTIKRDSLDLNI